MCLNRTLFCRIAAFGLLLGGASLASAAPALSLYDSTGDPNAITISPSQSFTVILRLTADMAFQNFSIYLADPTYTGTPRFTITNRTIASANPFTDAQTSNSVFASDPLDTMTRDLGYSADAGSAAAGAYDLMTLTFATSATAPGGTYAVGYNAASILTDAAGNERGFAGSTPYTVTVSTPEPALLGTFGLACVAALARRRTRAS